VVAQRAHVERAHVPRNPMERVEREQLLERAIRTPVVAELVVAREMEHHLPRAARGVTQPDAQRLAVAASFARIVVGGRGGAERAHLLDAKDTVERARPTL